MFEELQSCYSKRIKNFLSEEERSSQILSKKAKFINFGNWQFRETFRLNSRRVHERFTPLLKHRFSHSLSLRTFPIRKGKWSGRSKGRAMDGDVLLLLSPLFSCPESDHYPNIFHLLFPLDLFRPIPRLGTSLPPALPYNLQILPSSCIYVVTNGRTTP